MDSGIRTNPSSTKQGSANPVGAYAMLVLQKDTLFAPCRSLQNGLSSKSFFLLIFFLGGVIGTIPRQLPKLSQIFTCRKKSSLLTERVELPFPIIMIVIESDYR